MTTGAQFLSRISVSVDAFRRSWGNPEQAVAASLQSTRAERYARLWQLYDGTAFDNMEEWAQYRRAFGLYRQIRLVWDHVHSLVEFYATHIWPGTLAADGLALPDGVQNAIPLAKDTDRKLAAAIGQLWLWWNFQQTKDILARYTAALGELLVELIDDPDRGKLVLNMVWPAYVKDIRLDESGNVKYYCIQYQAWDEDRKEYFTYRREVDKTSFRTYKNGRPFDYTSSTRQTSEATGGTVVYSDMDTTGDNSGIENPYGFVPACWFRHTPVLGVRGEPAAWATLGQLDELNSLFSHIIDKTHINLRAPIIVAGNIAPNAFKRALDNMVGQVKRTFTEELTSPRGDAENLNVLQGPAGTGISTIEIHISEAVLALDRMVATIERKCPEVTFYDRLRNMTQLTGAAASRLMGDVEHRVKSIASGYDRQLIKLQQMGVAIAGWRLEQGDGTWSDKNGEQQKFTGFNLDSYDQGDLDHNVMPRELLPLTALERAQMLQAKKLVFPSLPELQIAEELGYDKAQAEEWIADAEAKKLEEQQQAFDQQVELATIPRPAGAPPGGPQRGQSNQNRNTGRQPVSRSE